MKTVMCLKSLPKIVSVNEISHKSSSFFYTEAVEKILKKILQVHFYQEELTEEVLMNKLPVIVFSSLDKPPFSFSTYIFSKFRPGAGVFFLEMISRWLIPGKRNNLSVFFATDILLPELGDQVYTVAEVGITIRDPQDIERLRVNRKAIVGELELGISSAYHAHQILEMKGLSVNEKTTIIQEKIAQLIYRFPKKFDYDVFSEMQQFFLATPEAFKGMRDCRYMTRIVCTLYRFQKILTELVENESKARHLIVKFYKTRLQLPFGVKPVLGIFIGLNFLRENEVFAKKHIIKAIHTVIPSALSIDDGYFVSKNEDKAIHTLYLEIEKENGKKFTPMELLLLRQELSGNLKGRIEHLLRPIFMPRNEEEVMRNMITLSQQLKYVRDLPQVIISFDEQTDVDLSFTIILVRVLLENALPIKDLFQSKGSLLQFFPDRKKNIGMIRKKYPKEASVFQVKLSNNTFLREDQSLDLYQARQFVLTELQRVFGEVRDYNGGMLSKQNEIYHALLQLLGNLGIKHSFLLENFFHSIFPVEHRSVLPPKYLQKLFLMLLDLQVQKTISEEGAWRKLAFFEHRLFTVMIFQDLELKQKLIEEVSRLQLHSSELISLHLQESERSFLGYIFLGDDQKKQTALLQIIEGSSD